MHTPGTVAFLPPHSMRRTSHLETLPSNPGGATSASSDVKLFQAEVHTAFIPEAVAILRQDYRFVDVRELRQCRFQFSLHLPIGDHTWRVDRAAKLERRRSWLRCRALLIKRDFEVWPATVGGAGENAPTRTD